jgi:hypothetical protein
MKANRPTKTAAIKHARANVSELYRFGDGYRFKYFDAKHNAWRESTPAPIYAAIGSRSQALIDFANEHLGHERDHADQYDGGNWTSYIRA